MSNKRVVILELFCQGQRQCNIVRLLNVFQKTMSDAIRCFMSLTMLVAIQEVKASSLLALPGNVRKDRVQQYPKVSMRKIAS